MVNLSDKYDNWLVAKKPVNWLCRVHIMLPVIAVLYAVSTVLTFIVPVWTNFSIVIFINIVIAVILLILLFRFEFFYYDRALRLHQHIRVYFLNSFYLLLMGVFVFMSPYFMQKRIEARFGIENTYQKKFRVSNDPETIQWEDKVLDTNAVILQRSLAFKKDSVLATYFDIPDAQIQVPLNADYRKVNYNIETVLLTAIDPAVIKKNKESLRQTAAEFKALSKDSGSLIINVTDNSVLNRNNLLKTTFAINAINEKQEPERDVEITLNNVINRALFMSQDQIDSLKHYADSVCIRYELPFATKTGFHDLVFNYAPLLLKRGEFIEDNLTGGDYAYKRYDVILAELLVLLLVGAYIMIILLSRNRAVGFAAPLIVLLIFIIIYSISFISARSESGAAFFGIWGLFGTVILLFAVLNNRFRSILWAQAPAQIFNLMIYIALWYIIVLLYYTYFFGFGYKSSVESPSLAARLNNLFAGTVTKKFAFTMVLYCILAALNCFFISHYYKKIIRPSKN